MYLIVGLGNPESDYSKTRHNMGFNVINKLSEKYGIEVNKSKFKGLVGNGINNDYHDWWLEKTEDARKQEYIKSLRR